MKNNIVSKLAGIDVNLWQLCLNIDKIVFCANKERKNYSNYGYVDDL